MTKQQKIQEARELIQKTRGKIFSATFVKKDNTRRRMVARLGVTRHLQGGKRAYDPDKYNLVPVFDMENQGYRSINLETIEEFRCGREVVRFN